MLIGKIMSKSIILCLMWFLVAGDIYAQDKPVVFKRLTTRDGLSQNRIFDIVQDKYGFIWIGTEDGLNRYDGYNFKVFKNIPGDTTSLANNFAETLHISKKGELWLGGQQGGLSRFNFEDETFYNYPYDHFAQNSISGNFVRDISEDKKGNLWVINANNGFDYLDLESNSFYFMSKLLPQGYEINNEFYTFIYQDSQERLWVGGQDKLHLFNVTYSSSGIPRLKPIKLMDQKFLAELTTIKEDKKGNIWLGSIENGLLQFDNENNSLKSYKIAKTAIDLSNLSVIDIEMDKSGDLWISGFYSLDKFDISVEEGFGIIKINLENQQIQHFKNDPKDENSLSEDRVISLFFDRAGTLWIGTDLLGLNIYDNTLVKFALFKQDLQNKNGLQVEQIRGFHEDETGLLWIASAQGLVSYDKTKKRYQYYNHNPKDKNSISSDITRSIYDDGTYLWIGTMNGLNRFDKKTKKFKTFYLDPRANTSAQQFGNAVNSVNYNILELESMPGYLWYGSNGGGLVKFNKYDFTFKNYTHDPEDESSLNNRGNFVRTVWFSKSRPNELWLGSISGIHILNMETETFRDYTHDSKDENSLSDNNVMHFYEDEEGYVWISTYGGGLNRFDPKSEKFMRFTESNSGLPNNGVYGVLPDEDGNLWMSTNNGISRLNKKTFEFRNYTTDDGLQSEEYNGGAFFKSSSGEMFFGGINGFNSFFPAQVLDNQVIPEIVITDIKIFNKSLPVGGESPLKQQISNTQELTLAYWQNDISFDFVGLHYSNPSKNRYAFKLENYEENWRFVNNARAATYTNLDPGEYVFRVKGSNNDGLWNEAGKTLKLLILPPWWRTYWAYGSYVLLFILLIFAIDRIQRARLISKEKRRAEIAVLEAENKRQTQELEEARQLQLSMLPRELPQLPHLDIAVYMQTATEVGGDYYDFHVALDGTLTVVVGDATGHGMKAGTMVTAAKSLFNSYAPNPDILFSFSEITRCIKRMNFGKLSMCLTMLKIKGDKMEISTAGMPPSFIFRRDTRVVEEHMFKAMPLGTMEKFPYELKETALNSGDTILLMSDGLPELKNKSEEMYGYKRVRNGFEEVAEKSPEDIISYLKNEGSSWVNGEAPDDDVTFVVIKVK